MVFLLTLAPIPASSAVVLKMVGLLSLCDPGPWLQREQTKPHLLIIVLVCSNLSEGYMKDWCKVLISVLPNLEPRVERWKA